MSKAKFIILIFAVIAVPLSFSQAPAPSNAEIAKRLEASCTMTCHGPALIAQQRLDRAGWTREIDKMIRWGAVVPAAEKEPLIDYLTRAFNSARPLPNSFKAVPVGKGSDLYPIYCLNCHDDTLIANRRLDSAGWTSQVDRMIRIGAFVPAARKAELIDYLTATFGR